MSHRALILIAAVLGMRAPCAAQGVDGNWSVTWAQGVSVQRDGTVEVESWGTGTLELSQVADSVHGTWRRSWGRSLATWTVTGTLAAGRLELTATGGHSDDPELAAQLARVDHLRWEGTLEGGRLSGELWVVIPEMPGDPPPRPWRAER